MFLTSKDIFAIQHLIFERQHPLYVSEYQALITKANKILSSEPPSITGNESPNGKNYFFTESPYCGWFTFWGLYGHSCRDGQVNPKANREDYIQLRRMGVESVVLSLAYRLSGKPAYKLKLFQFLESWIVNPESRMAPQYTTQQSHIEISASNIALFYGLSLIAAELQKNPPLNQAAQDWLQGWANSIDSWRSDNNFEDWRLLCRLAIFSLLDDQQQFTATITAVKARLTQAISEEGRLVHELSRTKSLSYSLYALKAMLLSAEIAYHHGVDLYHVKDERGVGLETALLHHASFLLHNKKTWPFKQISELKKQEVALYELAHTRYKNEAFAQVIIEWERPFQEIRALQYISLTHSAVEEKGHKMPE